MDRKIGNLVKAVERWIEEFGAPVLIVALMIAGLMVIAHEFFSPLPLDVAISNDLQGQNETLQR